MTSAQETYYRGYVKKVTANNVAPIVGKRQEWPENLEGEEWTKEEGKGCLSPKWGDYQYGPTTVYTSNKGRVMEVQSLNGGLSFICAVHRTRDDFSSYRKPLGMFHYLNT